MKEIVVVSGKGGTGKTVITGSLAVLAQSKVMVDCDVDAPDLWFLLHPRVKERYRFRGGKVGIIDPEKCTQCGKCKELCRFGAIHQIAKTYIIDSLSCEGCGVCTIVCPEKAVSLKREERGEYFFSETNYGPFIHARLGIAQENSGKLVTQVKNKAREIARKKKIKYIIVDGPPGTGCPVISSLTGADTALIVTEPTLSGIHDMERVIQVAFHFGIKVFLCINKFDLNRENTKSIEELSSRKGIPVIGKIPFEERVIESVVKGFPLVEYIKGEIAKVIKEMWENLSRDEGKNNL